MKTIYIRGGKLDNLPTQTLTSHLERRGHKVNRVPVLGTDVVVCWGLSYQEGYPALNAKVNKFNKMEALFQFEKQGIAAPKVSQKEPGVAVEIAFPVLARKIHHSKGKDIIGCEGFPRLWNAILNRGREFWVPFIPTDTEFRVWVFKDKAFAIQEKVYKGEGEFKGYCRNNRFGFKFEKADDQRKNKELTVPAVAAVSALEMDFGAVDVLRGKDGKYYVLEVNSMPQIDSPKRVTGIRLARRISEWAEGQE